MIDLDRRPRSSPQAGWTSAVSQLGSGKQFAFGVIFASLTALCIYVVHHMASRSSTSAIATQAPTALPDGPRPASEFSRTVVLGKAPDPVLSEPSRPSFSCAGDLSATEAKICDEPLLGRLDADLAQVYQAALGAASDRKAFAQQQVRWARDERDACADVVCLQRVYELRLFALGGRRLRQD